MSEHTHTLELSFLPGVEPREVTVKHSHATKPEEPHRHTVRPILHTSYARTRDEEREPA